MDVTTDRAPKPDLRFAAAASRAEQFSVWAMRLWWRSYPELQASWGEFLHGFRVCGVAPAVESCHRFCSIALAAGGRGTGLACLHFPLILPGEELLLSALALGQEGDLGRIENTLRTLIPPSAARIAAPNVVRYAQILADAGLSWTTAKPASASSIEPRVVRAEIAAYERVTVTSGRVH